MVMVATSKAVSNTATSCQFKEKAGDLDLRRLLRLHRHGRSWRDVFSQIRGVACQSQIAVEIEG